MTIQPVSALAAIPDDTFLVKTADEAVAAVFGTSDAAESADIKLDAPLQAENGAVVPVEVTVNIPDTELVAVVVPKNNYPLVTVLEPTSTTSSYYSLRIKMAGTDTVRVYVKAGGKLYMASQEVRVAVGGCGG